MTRGRESNEAFVAIRGEDTPADVVADALSRSWVDRPAIAVRAELRVVGAADAAGSQSSPEWPLDAAEVRRLLERDTELERALGARAGLDFARREVASLARNRESLTRSIEERETQLDAARRTVAEFDRPLVRRRHRVELDIARRQLDWVPGAIDQERTKLGALDGHELRATARLQDAVALDERRPELMAERAIVRYRLDQDARTRGERLAAKPPAAVLDRLGPRPGSSAAAALWVDAVGRVSQHRVAFGQHGTRTLGPVPRLIDDEAYAASHRAASQAIERADRALGRELEIEAPHRSLGRSL